MTVGYASRAAGALRLEALKTLPPGYFAMVMATGIVAVSMHRFGIEPLNHALLMVAAVAYATLLALNAARLIRYPRETFADFADHARGPGFFTAVAATNVVANAIVIIEGWPAVARPLWIFSCCLWAVMLYAFGVSIIVRPEKPPLEQGINGGWLIPVVATQSISIGASNLAVSAADSGLMIFVASTMFMLGCALYLMLILLILYRLLFFPIAPADFAPTYWVNMGAAAISTLAGIEIGRRSHLWSVQVHALPVLEGFTLFMWVGATVWIPLLVLIGVWRHAIRRHPLAYEYQLWSMVFPLGMYSVATLVLSDHFKLSPLRYVAGVFAVIAVCVWAVVAFGFLKRSFETSSSYGAI